MTLTKRLSDPSIDVLAGSSLDGVVCTPLPPFSDEVLDFLAALSTELLERPDVRVWPDVVTFAYWCRRSNLKRLRESSDKRYARVGRGLVLHIAPSNVPVNFAFSLAFGMLAGNSNIVRVPSADYVQVQIIAEAIAQLFELPKYKRIADMNRLVRYPRNAAINRALSAVSHARMIWGGDATIAELRAVPTPPRCIDVTFPDRYSFCVLGAEAVLQLDPPGLAHLAQNFFNDAFLLDQNACSSPHLVVWMGDESLAAEAMTRFWPAVRQVVRKRNPDAATHSVERFVHVCETAMSTEECTTSEWRTGELARLRVKRLPANIENLRGSHGFFIEFVTDRLEALTPIITERYQTLTVAGVPLDEIQQWVIRDGLAGIDRVVPVGKALDMGPLWDGADLVASLSRVIAEI